MAVKVGRLAKVALAANKVAEMGVWSIDGITNDLIESTEFGDSFKTYEFGFSDYGTVSFSGYWDMTDTNGQKILESAHKNKSKIANIRFYVDAASYYTPDTTSVTDAGILIETLRIAFDKAGIGTIEFTAKCTGPMALV
jgi:hypothetical protein